VPGLTLRVRSLRRETPTTRIVRIDLAGAPFEFSPGQAARLGLHGRALKPYSIANAPDDVRRTGLVEFLIKSDAAGHADAHFHGLRRGSRVDLQGPLGFFSLPAALPGRTLLFIAGGTGIAPIRSMLRHVLARRPAGRLQLVYSVRLPGEFAYRREFRGLARRGRLDYTETVTRDAGPRWRGLRGRLDRSSLAPLVDPSALCFVCGPASLVDDVPRALRDLGVAQDRIRVEEW
jgi:ferredoxin-NADP reductase